MKGIKISYRNQIIAVSFILIIFVKIISLNYSIRMNQYSNVFTLLGILGSVLILTSIPQLFGERGRMRAFISINLIVSLIIFTDAVYNRYFMDLTSIALIHQARIAGEVRDSIGALLKVTDLKYFIDVFLMAIIYRITASGVKDAERTSLRARAVKSAAFLCAGILLSLISIHALEKDQPSILETFYDKKFVTTRIGSINFHAYDIYRYVSANLIKKEKLSDSDKKDVVSWVNRLGSPAQANHRGEMKGKNLIVVQLEAFQGFVLNRSINGQEITPNLNRLAKESLVLDNLYYQTSWGGTSDAEFLSNVSLLPAREGSVFYQYAGNTYESLVSALKGEGYTTSVMHANRPGFWNRTNMYSSLGFDSYESEGNFTIDDIQGLGLSDKSFFQQAVEKMKSYNKPFYSFLISLSSHFPYKDQNDRIKDIMDVGEFEGTVMGDYLKSVKYTDEAIGMFIEGLKNEGLWDNSVVVFYGDHSAINYDNKSLLGKLVYGKEDISELEWFTQQKVVSMIHFPGEEIRGNIEKPAGQIDLFPTLANLFDLDAKYALGQDLLNTEDSLVIIRPGSWVYNDKVYLMGLDRLYDTMSGSELNKSDYEEQFKIVEENIKNSDYIIENNLIEYFKEN